MQTLGTLVGSAGIATDRAALAASAPGPHRQTWSRPLDGAGRVELWFVPAGAHRLLAQDARILAREDWQAIARVRDEHARDLLRATRITLRRALSHAVGNRVKPEAWRFQTTAYGKPQVAPGLPQVQFCVSHIETMAVIAVSRDAPVGVDIETIGQPLDAALVEGFCSPRERQALAQLRGPQQKRAFARLWTLKEAYVKARGLGLARPTQRFTVKVDGAAATLSFDSTVRDQPSALQVARVSEVPGHHIAVTADIPTHDPNLTLI